jgi:5-amino-6-(5-phosphoribosylamino)uracil reductase
MAMSMDGKIATKARGPVKLGSARDSRRMAEIRAEHDVVVNGTGTFLAYPFPLKVSGADLVRERVKRNLPSQPASALVSSRLKIPTRTAWEKAAEIERWAFCGKGAPRAVVERLEKAGVIVVGGRAERVAPAEMLRTLEKAGKERILLEGGGDFNSLFLEKGLVDRIYLTLVPIVIGGAEAPTWFEGRGFAGKKFPRFRLEDCQNVSGELFLTYVR